MYFIRGLTYLPVDIQYSQYQQPSPSGVDYFSITSKICLLHKSDGLRCSDNYLDGLIEGANSFSASRRRLKAGELTIKVSPVMAAGL